MKKKTLFRISMREVQKSIRKPLPVQTGGVHKSSKRKSRQEQKVSIRRGNWD